MFGLRHMQPYVCDLDNQHMTRYERQKHRKSELEFSFFDAMRYTCPPAGKEHADSTDSCKSAEVYIAPRLQSIRSGDAKTNSTN